MPLVGLVVDAALSLVDRATFLPSVGADCSDLDHVFGTVIPRNAANGDVTIYFRGPTRGEMWTTVQGSGFNDVLGKGNSWVAPMSDEQRHKMLAQLVLGEGLVHTQRGCERGAAARAHGRVPEVEAAQAPGLAQELREVLRALRADAVLAEAQGGKHLEGQVSGAPPTRPATFLLWMVR